MIALIVLLDIFLAVSGYVGGRSLTNDPTGAQLHMPLQWLKRVPVIKNYFWPGIFLLIMFAYGGTVAAVTTVTNSALATWLNLGLGTVLIAWIMAEFIFIPEKQPIQYLYLLLGFALILLPAINQL